MTVIPDTRHAHWMHLISTVLLRLFVPNTESLVFKLDWILRHTMKNNKHHTVGTVKKWQIGKILERGKISYAQMV